MAVYTPITVQQLKTALAGFDVRLSGEPQPVAEGIENTTYFFDAAGADGQVEGYVLTILETCPLDQARFAAVLTRALNRAGLAVPCPKLDRHGKALLEIAGKRALILPRVAGGHIARPGAEHCRIIGDFLARAHGAADSLEYHLPNRRGLDWLARARETLAPRLSTPDRELLTDCVELWRRLDGEALPRGAIHADLFRDNALFDDGRLVAVIDFFNACDGWLLFDVAIAVNDWCRPDGSGRVDPALATALLQGYHCVRPFSATEAGCWRDMLSLAACRFWVSRLLVAHADLSGEKPLEAKDPAEFRRLIGEGNGAIPPLPCE